MRIDELLTCELTANERVSRILKALETSLRQTALGALADWENTGIASPGLFRGLAQLENPSWGGWNGLINELRIARKLAIEDNREHEIERIKAATFLDQVIQNRSEKIAHEALKDLRDCHAYLRYTLPERPQLKQVVEIPIVMRNIIAHQAPEAPEWWEWAEQTLRVIAKCLLDHGGLSFTPSLPCGPWMFESEGEVFAFNGFAASKEARYVSGSGRQSFRQDLGMQVVKSIKKMTGREDLQEENLRRLMRRLAPLEQAGIMLGDFLLQKPRGEGGFATVYEGVQVSSQRKVAVKVLKNGLDETARERFRQEAQHLSYFGGDNNIVDVIGFGEEHSDLPRGVAKDVLPWLESFVSGSRLKSFIALEWIEGHTLEDIMSQQASNEVSVATKAEWFLQIAKALRAVHGAGIMHRDIKPSNIMIEGDNRAILMDFGVARTESEERTIMTLTGQQFGTPAYMSPEQLRAKIAEDEVGKQSDIYSLGASFYELFTGLRLFDHDRVSSAEVQRKKLSHEAPAFTGVLARRLPWEIRTMLTGCLESEVCDRYKSSDQLSIDIQRYANNETITYRRPNIARRVRLAYRRNKTLFVASGVFFFLLAISTSLYIERINQANNNAQRARIKAEKVNRDIVTNLAPLTEKIIASPDMLLVDTYWKFLGKCDMHLTSRYYPDSIEDSLASARISAIFAASMVQKYNSAILIDGVHKDSYELKRAVAHTDQAGKIYEEVLKSFPVSEDGELLKLVQLSSDELVMTKGKLLLINDQIPEAIIRLKEFDNWVEAKLSSSPSKEIKIVLLYDRFECLPALAMAYRRNGAEDLAKTSWEACLKAGNEWVQLSPDNPQGIQNLWLRYRFGKALGFLEASEVDKKINDLTEEMKRRGLFSIEMEEALKEIFNDLAPR